MITYMDMEINNVQQQLKSIKNIQKIQNKVLIQDVENVEITQRLKDYEKEIKGYKDKMREIERRARKREQDFKKQQAYLVELKKKHRKFKEDDDQFQKNQQKEKTEIPKEEIAGVIEELRLAKEKYDTYCKKIESQRKRLKDCKHKKVLSDEKYLEKETQLKQLHIMIESYKRLLKDLEIKRYEQTGVR